MKSVRFDAQLETNLKRAARTLGISQSSFIREAVAKRCEEVLGDSLEKKLASIIGCIQTAGGRARNAGATFQRLLTKRRSHDTH